MLFEINIDNFIIMDFEIERSNTSNDDQKVYPCLVVDCNKSFNRRDHLKVHTNTVHKNNKKRCFLCGQILSINTALNRHQKSKEKTIQ